MKNNMQNIISLGWFLITFTSIILAEHPIIKDSFTADPAAIVYNNRDDIISPQKDLY